MRKILLIGGIVVALSQFVGCAKAQDDLCKVIGVGCAVHPGAPEVHSFTHTHKLNYSVPVKKFNSCKEVKSFLNSKTKNGGSYGAR